MAFTLAMMAEGAIKEISRMMYLSGFLLEGCDGRHEVKKVVELFMFFKTFFRYLKSILEIVLRGKT